MELQPTWARMAGGVAAGGALLLGLAATRLGGYLLFHTLAELFAVTIAFGIFMVGWNSRSFVQAGLLLLLGNAYLFVGVVDLLHTLTYSGLAVLPNAEGANLATQLWLVARYLEAGALLAAPFYFARPVRPWPSLLLFGAVAGGLTAAVFLGGFPDAFVDPTGLTPFKVASEFLISAALVGAAVLVHRRRRLIDRELYLYLMAALVVTVLAELSFTLYDDPYGAFNLLGHLLKIVSFYLLYKSTVQAGLRRPYAVLFRELAEREAALRSANAELTGYAHTVSHDLRGPLGSIRNANLVLRGTVGDANAQLVRMTDIIDRNVATAARLIDDTLAFAEAGTITEKVEDVPVREVIGQVLEERRAELDALGARVELGPDLGTVRAARTHVYQLFSNLVGNSLAHAGRPGLVITVSSPEGHRHRRFRFCDDGPGIPPEEQERIFQPFARGAGGGTGIGLSTVKKIVQTYGGSIRLLDVPGTCFELTLPNGSAARPSDAARTGT